MATFEIRDTHPIAASEYWEQIFFNDEYNQRLYKEALQFRDFAVLRMVRNSDGSIERNLRIEPQAEVPPVIQKIIGGALHYTEEGRFDPKTQRWSYRVIPSKMAEKTQITGQVWVEPKGEHALERICTCRVEVGVFGVGGLVEKFIAETTRKNYEEVARFTNTFIREKGY